MLENDLLTYNIDLKIANCKSHYEKLKVLYECKDELLSILKTKTLYRLVPRINENNDNMNIKSYFVAGKAHINKINELLKLIDIKIKSNKSESENGNDKGDLLNKETFLKYKDKFEWGFIPDEFETDLESIKSIKDKIIFINYIENQLQEYIEDMNFVLDMHNTKIDNYYKDKDYYDKIITEEREKKKREKEERIKQKDIPKEKLKVFRDFVNKFNNINNYEYLLREKSNKEEKIDFLKYSLFAIQDKQNFWNEQLKIECGELKENIKPAFNNTKDIKFDSFNFNKSKIEKYIDSISNIKSKLIYLKWIYIKLQDKHKICIEYSIKELKKKYGDDFGAFIFSEEKKYRNKHKDYLIEVEYTTEGDKYYQTYIYIDLLSLIEFIRKQIEFCTDSLLIQNSESDIQNNNENIKMVGANIISDKKEKAKIRRKKISKYCIKWLQNDNELYYLVKNLKLDLRKENLFFDFIKNHFIDKRGKPYKEKNITQGISDMVNNIKYFKSSEKGKFLNKIIDNSFKNDELSFDILLNELVSKNFITRKDSTNINPLKALLNLH